MTKPQSPHRGYIEGYYGRLLAWDERHRLITTLARLGMTRYLYAPKEDPCHRLHWRSDWDDAWWQDFRAFAETAREHGIEVMAGIAPGADFDFASLDGDGNDADTLIAKARALMAAGAGAISLLLDDIDPLFGERRGRFETEGEAHATLANRLADALGQPVSVTPRIYADEITDAADGYLEAFAAILAPSAMVFTCGSHIVAPALDFGETRLAKAGIAPARMIAWDNLYANDYCPRRLFLGAFHGREAHKAVMLNPTGMIDTDALLLAIMAAGPDDEAWAATLRNHGVPEAFFTIARFFGHPPDPRAQPEPPDTALEADHAEACLDALDVLLWRWKSPLQREWYPFLMGLRGDLLYRSGAIDARRLTKIMPPLLAAPLRQGD